MSDAELLAAVKARVARDKARHSQEEGSGLCLGCVGADWPCDAARYLSFAEARLAWIEAMLGTKRSDSETSTRREDARAELREMAKLLGVQG